MLYIVSLLVTYDTMVSLICFFFALFLIHSFGLHRGVWVSRSSGRVRYGAGAPGTRASESELAVPRLSFSATRGSFPDRRESLCPLHRQAGTDPLGHQGGPVSFFLFLLFFFLPGVRTLSIRSTHFNF